MAAVELSIGNIHYDDVGPRDGSPVVCVHGYLMGASLFAPLAQRLAADGFRCIVPTWPLGAHTEPVKPDADLSIHGVAAAVAELITTLGLDDTVLVGNDTGGLICQVVAGTYPERLGALVLTSCDAFDHFPPGILQPFIQASRVPFSAAFRTALQPLRTSVVRRPAYGALSNSDIDHLVAEWVEPALSDARIADDLRRFTASLTQSDSTGAATRLANYGKPALVAWSADDKFFPVEDGRKLASTLPDGRFELIEDSRTFSMLDQPDVLTALIADVAFRAPSQLR